MQKFDAEEALGLIEKHQITHSQWVPTMFVRMFKLDESTRSNLNIRTNIVGTDVQVGRIHPVQV